MSRRFRNSTADYLSIGDVSEVADPRTLSVWVYPFSLGIDTDVITKWQNTADRSWLISIGPDNELDWNILANDNVGYGSTTPGVKVRVGHWSHLVGTCQWVVGSNLVQSFHNGISGIQTEVFASAIKDSTIGAQIGKRQDNGGGEFNGIVCSVAIWGRVLLHHEIRDIYLRGPGSEPYINRNSLTAYWPIHHELVQWLRSGNNWSLNGKVDIDVLQRARRRHGLELDHLKAVAAAPFVQQIIRHVS